MTKKDWQKIEEILKAAGTYKPGVPSSLPPSICSAEWMRRRIASALAFEFGETVPDMETEPKGLGALL